MQSHLDSDFMRRNQLSERFLAELQGRVEAIKQQEASQITGGTDGELVLAEWESNSVHVKQRPDDPQGILRISIGGGDDLPVSLNYLVFRGNRGKCVDLLRKALKALETDPK